MISFFRKIRNIPHHIKSNIRRILNQRHRYDFPSENNGWKKICKSPIWGNKETGTMFDPFIFEDGKSFKMVVSARKTKSIGLIESKDGIHWGYYKTILECAPQKWDDNVNRGCIVKHNSEYFLWYTGQKGNTSSIGLAKSYDGQTYTRYSEGPIMFADQNHEGTSIMNPCVLWNRIKQLFQMWYAAGENYEPDVICYAESIDGVNWTKKDAPVLKAIVDHEWEKYKVGGCSVVLELDGSYTMYYIGYQNVDVARICYAVSKDGIHWTRSDNNLIISPSRASWDADATYKPAYFSIGNNAFICYNGRKKHSEYIGIILKKTDNNIK